jgi:hypothetical protein
MAYVNSTSGGSDSGVTNYNLAAFNLTAGNFVAVGIKYEGASTTLTVTDTDGNSYSPLTRRDHSNGDLHHQVFYTWNAGGHATNVINIAYGAARSFGASCTAQYSGIETASDPFDQENFGQNTGTLMTTSSVTTTQADEVLIEFTANYDATTYTATGGFTERFDDGGPFYQAVADQIVSSTGTYSGSMTLTPSSAWILNMATFKMAGGAPAADQPTMRRWGGVPGMTPGGLKQGRTWFKGLTLPQRKILRPVYG